MAENVCVNDGKVTKIKDYKFSQEEYHIRIYDDEPIDIIFNSTMILLDACIVKIKQGNGIKTAKMALPLYDYGYDWDRAIEEIIKEALRL